MSHDQPPLNWCRLARRSYLYCANPGLDCDEGLLLADVIDQDDALCPAVVGLGDRLKPLLPRCVPELKGDDLTVQFQSLAVEVNS